MKCNGCGEDHNVFDMVTVSRIDKTPNCYSQFRPYEPRKLEFCWVCYRKRERALSEIR